jgi:hypothetical protein
MERQDVPGIQPAHGWPGPQGREAPAEVQGAEALPRIQTAHGWEGAEGSGSAPFVGAWGQRPRRAANGVCVSAPFGLSVHAVDASMGTEKIEVRLPLHSL